jgi:hypothetical protein
MEKKEHSMRGKIFAAIFFIVIVFSFGLIEAHATLSVVGNDGSGNQFIYDSDLNITWYDFTYKDPALTPITGTTWARAVTWVESLNAGGVTGWRLPTTPGTSQSNDSEGEMGHLYYTDMVRVGAGEAIAPFQHIIGGIYWYGTEVSSNTSRAWDFSFSAGNQGNYDKIDHYYYALAVHDGNVAAVPIPGAIFLIVPGLAGLVALRRRVKK